MELQFCGRDPNHSHGSFAAGENMNALSSLLVYIYAWRPLVRYGIILYFITRPQKNGATSIVVGNSPKTLECLRNVKFCGRDPNHSHGSFAAGENTRVLSSLLVYIYAW